MGVESKKKSAPPLPAPTETESLSTPTELTTDVSKPGDDKSSYSLPDDGTPVTIKTRGHRPNRSQTSLLIEYFEGGKIASSSAGGADRKPSVRVRLTPSKNRKNDHIQITETKSARKASLTRRSAPVSPAARAEGEAPSALGGGDLEDAKSMSSYASATEESNVSRNPIDIEIDRSGRARRRRPASPLIPAADDSKASYQPPNMSDISAIPTDSFLDGSGHSSKTPERKRTASPSRTGDILAGAAAGLAAAAVTDKIRSKSRNEERERVVVPKSRDRDKSDRKYKSSKSRTSSLSEKDVKSPRRRSSRGQQESVVSAADSSVLSSQLSPSHRSVDQHSVRSGTSKSSINNPKLLETVEDAIRRLILPELNALKREQSRHKDRRGSVTSSATSISRDEYASDRRRSSGTEKHVESPRDSYKSKERRDREARHDLDESPAHSVGHDSVEEIIHDTDNTPRRSGGKLMAAAAGAALGGLAGAAMHNDKSPVDDTRQRRRRRAELRSRGSDKFAEEYYDDEHHDPVAPMPLMSEINPSEVTRTSILSAESDRPHSASEEQVHDGASSPTPTRSPTTLQGLGTQHANVSHGDLKALPRRRTEEFGEEYETDAYGQQAAVPMPVPEPYEEEEEEEMGHSAMPYAPDAYNYYNTQVVPPPLNYVPYQPERRGLSPIPSVSGYTEGGSEQPNRDSKVTHTTTGSYSSPDKSPYHGDVGRHSPSSIPSNVMSREFVDEDGSPRSSGVDYRNTTYTDDSELDRVTSGQAVRAVGANPNFVHPVGVESAVASLVDGSMLDESVLTGASGYDGNQQYSHRDSIGDVYEEEISHGRITPTQESVASQRDELLEDRSQTPVSASQHSREFADEYDIDEYGKKVARSRYRQSPTAFEAAITGAAVGAAAEALRAAAKNRSKQHSVEEEREAAEDFPHSGAGIVRNKSFKERTMNGERPANTPTHSIDRFVEEYEKPKMVASGIPDPSDPMPEIGYLGHEEDIETNPSVVEGRLGGTNAASQDTWQGHPPTPHLEDYGRKRDIPHRGSGNGAGLGITEAAGAAAVATAAALASAHSRQPSQEQEEEWQRTSDDRKRDTLVTNPYEGASPIVNLPGLNDNLLGGTTGYDNGPYDDDYGTRSPLGPKVDEGYISQGPNKTPDMHGAKAKGVEFKAQPVLAPGEDPFFTPPKHTRHLSGLSQGMASPFYDAATGTGIDRIESKDIIALMQHLMVRDAQRSARDTEILVTLVRSAADMRNSFEDIKKMLADTEDVIITEVKDNTEKSVRNAIGGPRPFPGSGARSLQGGGSQAGTVDDLPQKKSLWKRALKGLSSKSANDLGRIEEMLMQLLTEVDTLKSQQAQGAGTSNQEVPGASFDNLQPEVQYEQDRGYEPEGNAGTSTASHASHSGHLSIPQSRGASVQKLGYDRKFSDHRISTVPEANEDEFDHSDPNVQPHYSNPNVQDVHRGTSEPLGTPPQPPAAAQASHSNENTPKTDKGKKHGSWFPKISRWSGTTTSSVTKALRQSGRKDNEEANAFQNAPSRSGSDMDRYEQDYVRTDPYGDDKLHSGFSEPDIHNSGDLNQSPTHQMVSPILSMTPEDPKYKAHRNSVNLQHPQPRQVQSERFKVALESQAQEFDSPMSPKSAEWAGSATSLNRFPGRNASRESYGSGAAAAAQDQRYWPSSSPGAGASTGPPRPPKEPLDEASSNNNLHATATPPKSNNNRISKLQKASPLPYHSVESGYGTATHGARTSYTGSPRLENRNLSGALGIPARRPSGPRAMTPKSAGSAGDDGEADARRRKRDTFGTVSSQESETF